MELQGDRSVGAGKVLHQHAVRAPLRTPTAERRFHETMMAVADARERKAALLADPRTSVLDAYETALDELTERFERTVRDVSTDDYEAVAMAYQRGDRNDPFGAVCAYFLEGVWRVQQRLTVTDMLFSPLVLRYPESVTVNLRFATGYTTPDSVRFESAEHLAEDLDEKHARMYRRDCLHSQKRAAEYVEASAELIREAFPDPSETPFESRKLGGVVAASGRKGPVFTSYLDRVDPDPTRFAEPVEEPKVVRAGPEAKRTTRELFADAVVL
jgi:hypothetical protein